ncbi:hypothetical protein D3C87_76870 [compost metagenome]
MTFEELKEDIDIVTASAALINFSVEFYKDINVTNNTVNIGYYYFFRKNDKYMFTIYAIALDNVTDTIQHVELCKSGKSFISIDNPSKQDIVKSMPKLLKKIVKE